MAAGVVGAGEITVQVEGCRKADITQAGGDDWIKEFRTLKLTPKKRPAPKKGQGRGRRGEALLRHPQAHAPAVLQHHRPQLLGRREGRDLRLARRQLHRFRPGGGAPVLGRRAAACGPLHQLERLADRTARPLRPRRPVRRPVRRLERVPQGHGAGQDRPRQPAPRLHGLRVLPSADGADPPSQHRQADRLAPRRHPRHLRHRGVHRAVPAGDGVPRAHDPGAAGGRDHRGDLRFHPPLPRLQGLPLRRYPRGHAAAQPAPSRSIRRWTTGCRCRTSGPAPRSRPSPAAARIRGVRGSRRQELQDRRRAGRTLHRQRGRPRRLRRPAVPERARPGIRPDRRHQLLRSQASAVLPAALRRRQPRRRRRQLLPPQHRRAGALAAGGSALRADHRAGLPRAIPARSQKRRSHRAGLVEPAPTTAIPSS